MILLIILFNFASSYAQNYIAKGIKLGLNLATLSGDNVEDTEFKLGLVGGVFFVNKINDYYSFQPEILFTMKGSNFAGQGYTASQTIIYLEAPLLMKFSLIKESKLKPFIFIGPALNYNISATYKISSDWGNDSGKLKGISEFDFGLVFGSDLTINNMIFDIRYEMAISSLLVSGYNPSIYNRCLSITFGFTL